MSNGELKSGKNFDDLLNIEAYKERLRFVEKSAPLHYSRIRSLGHQVLVVGGAVGGEALAVLEEGFAKVVSTEINRAEIEYGRHFVEERGEGHRVRFIHQEALALEGSFGLILSGHVIEHTINAYDHLSELSTHATEGALLFIEFPSRFNFRELHTGLISFEWLPAPFRSLMNRLAAGGASVAGAKDYAQKRHDINDLQQVSTMSATRTVRGFGWKPAGRSVPAPGIVRLLFLREG